MHDLRAIWSGVREGRADAWRALVRVYAGLVFTVARRTGLSEADAEDCAQHTWLALYRRRRAIKDPKALPAWLIRTTHREAVALARRRTQFRELDAAAGAPAAEPLPDAVVERLELEAHLEYAIGLLDARCRRLVRSLFLSAEPASYRDLARLLGVKPNSFGPLRSRCLERLEKILREIGYSPD